MDNIVFDSKPEKNELYLLNVFPMKKKNEECVPVNLKYCSRGVHLGLSNICDYLDANIRDDLESICYILMDVYTQGNFLKNVKE